MCGHYPGLPKMRVREKFHVGFCFFSGAGRACQAGMRWGGVVWAWGCQKRYYLAISDYWESVRDHVLCLFIFIIIITFFLGGGGWPYLHNLEQQPFKPGKAEPFLTMPGVAQRKQRLAIRSAH